jgi:hypothetical protein
MILQKIMFAFQVRTAILALWRLIIAYNSAAGQNRLLHAHNTKIFILSVSHISIVAMHQCHKSRGQIY